MATLKTVNNDIFTYAADNQCTDGPMKIALDSFAKNFAHDLRLVQAGLALVVISFAALLLLILYASPLRLYIAECCIPAWKEPPALEKKMTNMRDSMKEGIKRKITTLRNKEA